jgi:hypothetical protein
MFSTQNLATSLFPCGYNFHTFCGYGYYTYCGYAYYTNCGYYYNTFHCGYAYLTGCHFPGTLPQVQAPVCPGAASIPAQVGPGDPVEAIQALRQQLEVALAGLRAQEEELRRQRAAGGGGAG